MPRAQLVLVLVSISVAGSVPGCAAPVPQAKPFAAVAQATSELPGLRLPSDLRPTAQSLTLTVDPAQARMRGVTDIQVVLDKPRTQLWLHGKDLHVTRAAVMPEHGAPIEGAWAQRDDAGMSVVTLTSAVAAGKATLHIEFDVAVGTHLDGMYRVSQAGVPYVFTQFEPMGARTAFPCFDEPAFKIPWDEHLVVPAALEGVANTKEIERNIDGANKHLHFATTRPLPSYLVAFAVGALDIVVAPDVPPNAVRTRPLALRAVTAKDRGKDVAYALAHTGEILATLELFVGHEYPYDKLDIIAVPDKGGAMENPGAITFSDSLVLFDEKTAPLRQKRAYASVMAHELAHMWTGDLVTASWWDDIWLNEAFASWLGPKAADHWNPALELGMTLLDNVHSAMRSDSLASARAIRQPIVSTHDIENAFDGITYRKGAAVLGMFERWIGAQAFMQGLSRHLGKHRDGAATADDFLDTESTVAGKDAKTPFRTFLDQPGVPVVDVATTCAAEAQLQLTQSRYVPLGVKASTEQTWQIPVCARFSVKGKATEACTLLTEKTGALALGKECPDWVMPNAGASGYYAFSLSEPDLQKLAGKGVGALSSYERVSYADSLRSAFRRGSLPMRAAIEAVAPLVSDERNHSVAEAPMYYVGVARDWLYADPLRAAIETYGRKLYAPLYQRLGWKVKNANDANGVQLHVALLDFLATEVRDPVVRAEARNLGLAYLGYRNDGKLHPEAIDANFTAIALTVVGEEADAALWDFAEKQLIASNDAEVRSRLMQLLSATQNPALVDRARRLSLSDNVRSTEVMTPIEAQMERPLLRDATWTWVKQNFDAVVYAVPAHHGQTNVIMVASYFCDEPHAQDAEAFLKPWADKIEGGPRVFASALEIVRGCVARREKHEASVRAFFSKKR